MSNSGGPNPKFIHPAEEVFAHILDFYGIDWQYEPRSFALQWDERGNVTEAFRPDFFLPQQNLYIELTTLRPRLSTRKNRKLRRMKELYPDVQIKLFKRRDMRDLMVKYGLITEAQHIRGTTAQPSGVAQVSRPAQENGTEQPAGPVPSSTVVPTDTTTQVEGNGTDRNGHATPTNGTNGKKNPVHPDENAKPSTVPPSRMNTPNVPHESASSEERG